MADRIRAAAHEVQRPVFYAITIIITAYLPIFTLQRVEGRLFRPMAWTVAFALLGAVIFSMTIAPVLASFLFRKEARDWQNPVLVWLTDRYRRDLAWSVDHRWAMIVVAIAAVCISGFLMVTDTIGSEFLPHLDEGALWVRGTLAPSTGPTEGIRVMNQARIVLCSFPEVTECTSQTGRPDDGTDTTGFFNTEYFVGLKPKEQWRPVFHEDKDELIAAMQRELDKIPGVVWGFSQPIADNMEEAVSGVKGRACHQGLWRRSADPRRQGQLKLPASCARSKALRTWEFFSVLGQPNLNVTVDRQAGRPLPDQCGRRAGCDPDRGRRQRPDPSPAG